MRVALLALKYILQDELPAKLREIMELMVTLSRQETGLEYLETVLRYLAGAGSQLAEGELRSAVESSFEERGGTLRATIAEKWFEEGLQEGLREGQQQGLQEGLQEELQRGLQQGIREGLLDGIKLGLKLRFGKDGMRLMPEIYKIEDVDLRFAGIRPRNNCMISSSVKMPASTEISIWDRCNCTHAP